MGHHIQGKNINQSGADIINAVSVTKYQKYPSILILKHTNVLSEVTKLHDVNLYKIIPYNKCTVLKSTYTQRPYWKFFEIESFQIPVYNYQSNWVHNTKIYILKLLCYV